MIDLETLDTEPDAVILSIGAVFFDENGTYETFYRELDAQKQIDLGRTVSFSTLQWWITQKGMFPKSCGATDFHMDMIDFDMFCRTHGNIKPWGNGATFDITKMESLYKIANMEVPWKFWNIRDVRTVVDFFPECKGNVKNNHNALDDAINQADWVRKAMQMKGK